MSPRTVLALLALVVAVSLVGAPVTMSDWGQQGSHYVEQAEDLDNETPVYQYESLSPAAQAAFQSAIESADGFHTVYGYDDLPEEFFYSDYARPGKGVYGIEYGGDLYRLETYAGGGFPFVYWAMELPFVVFGALLGLASVRLERGDESPTAVALTTLVGAGVHLVGPEFDFPVVEPGMFFRLGIVLAVVLAAWLVRGVVPDSWRPGADSV